MTLAGPSCSIWSTVAQLCLGSWVPRLLSVFTGAEVVSTYGAGLPVLLALTMSAGACAQTSPERGATAAQTGSAAVEAERVPASSQDANALASWAGRYEFTDSAGRTVGGTGVVTTYRLEVPREASSPCSMQIAGFQSDTTLLCELSATPAELSVRFLSYADGRTVNEFGVTVYEPHQVLFTLRRGAGEKRLATTWQALRPDGVREQSGAYFEKTDAISR